MVVFEEDRPARAALKAAGVQREYFKFNEHHQDITIEHVRESLKSGLTVVYMSDQGSPSLADPGRHLNQLAFELGATVKVIPGPSSITAALSAAPFETNTFRYLGFPPREPAEKSRFLQTHIASCDCLVLLDTPYRLKSLIESLSDSHPNQRALLAIDISGDNETYTYGSFLSLKKAIPKDKLNFVLIIEGSSKQAQDRKIQGKKLDTNGRFQKRRHY